MRSLYYTHIARTRSPIRKRRSYRYSLVLLPMDMKTPLHPSSSSQIDPEAMKQEDRGNTRSYDEKKSKDDEELLPQIENFNLKSPVAIGSSSAMGESRVPNVPFEDSDIEMGGTHSLDGVPDEPRLVDPSSDHLAHEDPWQRLATMVDPLFGVNVQGAFSLVAYKSSDASSAAKDVLFCFVVFLFVLGFSAALGGKFCRSSKMGVIGLGAAALGFLMTMVLVVVHKI